MNFLFELYTEEIPAFYQIKAISYLKEYIPFILKTNQISYKSYQADGTPKRLFFYINELAPRQNSWKEEKKGPPEKLCYNDEGKPSEQLLGFCKRLNADIKDVKFKRHGKENHAFLNSLLGGVSSLDILAKDIPEMFLKIPFKRKMRWGEGEIYYARSIIHYFCLYDSQKINFSKKYNDIFWKQISFCEEIVIDTFTTKKINISQPTDYIKNLATHGIQVISSEKKKLY